MFVFDLGYFQPVVGRRCQRFMSLTKPATREMVRWSLPRVEVVCNRGKTNGGLPEA